MNEQELIIEAYAQRLAAESHQRIAAETRVALLTQEVARLQALVAPTSAQDSEVVEA